MEFIKDGSRAKWLAIGMGLCLMVGSLTVRSASAATAADCPPAYDHSTLVGGEDAVGWTVSSGQTPDAFAVEILGVLDNALAPGRDLIIVEVNGAALDEAGGIWAGMSGSPVYIGTQLVGAVSYGFSAGPSMIGGVTPYDDMEDIYNYPSAGARAQAKKVVLKGAMRRVVARREGVSENQVSTLKRLKLPLALSGVSSDRYRVINRAFRKANVPFFAAPGGSAAAQSSGDPVVGTLAEGDNLAAALSYGDITSAAVGTVTATCVDYVLGFGHPFFFEGETLMGANEATAITVVNDPTFGPFKMATIGQLAGTVDQDRLAGIRIDTTTGPDTIPITSDITNLDTSATRNGETDVVRQEDVPFLAGLHLLASLDSIFDAIGEGTSELSFTVEGTHDGEPFTLTRDNKFASTFDISYETIFEMQDYLFQIGDFDNDVEFTSVDMTASATAELIRYRLKTLESRVGDGVYERTKVLRVKSGQRLHLRVTLEPSDDTSDVQVELSFKLPDNLTDGEVTVGNSSGGGFFFEPGFGGKATAMGADTFEELLQTLNDASTNDELTATLRSGRRFKVTAEDSELLDQVVSGIKRLTLRVKGGGAVIGPDGPGATAPGHRI